MSNNNKKKELKANFPCFVDNFQRKSFPLHGMVYLFLSPEKSIYIHSGHVLKMIKNGLEEWGTVSGVMKTPDCQKEESFLKVKKDGSFFTEPC